MRKVYLTKLHWTASPCSCTLGDLELDAKAEEASGDRVRIVVTSATRDGRKFRPNGHAQRAVLGGILIANCCHDARNPTELWTCRPKENLRLCSSHRTAEGKWVRERRLAKTHERASFGTPVWSDSRGQPRVTTASHLDALLFHNGVLTACSAVGTRVMLCCRTCDVGVASL